MSITSTDGAAAISAPVTISLPAFPTFDVEEFSTVANRWTKYKRRFENLCIALNVTNDRQKLAMLLNYVGQPVNDIYDGLLIDGDAETYANALTLLNKHFKPQSNTSVEIYNFRRLNQEPDEKLHQYYTRLRTQALKCEFGDMLDTEIKRQIEHGTNMHHLRRHSFRKQELTLQQLLTYGKDLEDTEFRTDVFGEEKKQDVNKLTEYAKFGKNPQQERRGKFSVANKQSQKKCYRCGGNFPHNTKKCPAVGMKCNFCSKLGHFERCCLSKSRQQHSNHKNSNAIETCSSPRFSYFLSDSESEVGSTGSEKVWSLSTKEEQFINATEVCKSNRNKFVTKIKVEKDFIEDFLIDTGSSPNILNLKTFQKLQKKKALKLSKTNTKVITYGENQLNVLGVTNLLCESKNKIVCEEFYVIHTENQNILSGDISIELGLLSLHVNQTKLASDFENDLKTTPECLREMLSKYKDSLFSGKIGKVKNTQIKLHIDERVPPVAERERRIPFALRQEVKKQIELLEKADIIEDVTSMPTPWLSQMVIVPQGDKVRMCIDMRNANRAITRTRYPTPTVDDLIAKLTGAKWFSKLDMNKAFHQLELDPESRYITAFQTEDRIKRFKRLSFGINSAPEELQHALRTLLADIPGAINIADDILVFGTTQEQHNHSLSQTLECLRKNGVTLNFKKCIFSKRHLEYYGYVFSEEGMRPSESKIQALREIERPENVSAVRSFLGFANYLKRFIPDYSTITHPLRQLTKKDAVFKWCDKCEKAFQTIITSLSEKSCVSYFSENKETFIYCDASPVGISAILLQQTPGKKDLQVINYSSRSLTETESRYSQIERECLSMVYACERNRIYVLGRKFTLFNDQKALINLLNNANAKVPLRIERMFLRLQGYAFTAKHITSEQNISDYISRHPKIVNTNEINYIESYVNMVTEFSTPKAFCIKDIATETNKDNELSILKKFIRENNWYTLNEPQKHSYLKEVSIETLKRYRKIKDELTISLKHDVILKGHRIVLPKKFEKDAVKICHVGHQGIEKTKG